MTNTRRAADVALLILLFVLAFVVFFAVAMWLPVGG